MIPVNVVLIGPPGCGKGTQAVRLAERYGIPHISTGEILRGAVRDGSELGRQVADILTKGSLVSDDLMTDLVRERLREPVSEHPAADAADADPSARRLWHRHRERTRWNRSC